MRPKIIMSRQSSEPLILLDSGVVRHFINGNRILELQQVFPGWFVMLDKVKNELCRSKSIENIVINLIRMTGMQLMQFPTEMEIIREYAILKRQFGDGESACMAVAKYQKHYIASSNLKDIKTYCDVNSIVYLTTMDILLEAIIKRVLSEEECDVFIQIVKSKGSKLPCNPIAEYRELKNRYG
jgi:hypothetical protein